MKKITPKTLLNPTRASGYDHVQSHGGGTPVHKRRWRAIKYGGKLDSAGRSWTGPSRATPLEAAQDYCDYVNSGKAPAPTSLKSAGHKRPQQPKRRVPSDIQAARGMVRDWEAQQRKGAQGYVYMIIEDNPGGGLGYCKIGYSVCPEKRVTELQTANPRPLKLLYKMKGTETDERRLHHKYRDINVLQEWFNLNSSRGKDLLLEFPSKAAVR